MKILPAALLALVLPAIVAAQDGPEVSEARGAVLRTLDRLTGKIADITLENKAQAQLGQLTITLGDCRYPTGNPADNAYAEMTITDAKLDGQVVFSGWMIADSPALSALDHPRYDVWVLSCIQPDSPATP